MRTKIKFILFFLISNIIVSQNIKGIIKGSENNPLFGATIFNSSNNKSTITNEDGEFTIESKNGENKLFISYVGHKSKKY